VAAVFSAFFRFDLVEALAELEAVLGHD